MLRSFFLSILAAACIPFVSADVDISKPSTDTSVTASSGKATVEIKWSSDGSSPSLDDATAFTFKLCTGPNTDIIGVDTIKSIVPSDISSNTYKASFDASAYSAGKYYVQIYTTFKSGSYTIHYSPRFTIEGLTGSKKASGTGDPPDAQGSVDQQQSANSASFTVPYTLQTGKTRYAPMQTQPGTTITVSTWSRRYPTSAVTYYTTFRKSLDQQSTVTPGWSYTVESLVNDASPAPFPSEVGWYSATKRLQSATLEGSVRKLQKRRWDD